jgi:hypothetical protein
MGELCRLRKAYVGKTQYTFDRMPRVSRKNTTFDLGVLEPVHLNMTECTCQHRPHLRLPAVMREVGCQERKLIATLECRPQQVGIVATGCYRPRAGTLRIRIITSERPGVGRT